MKVAIVHYWLVTMRGGEKVLEELCKLYPQADIFTLVVDEASLSPILRKHKITTSFLQSIPGSRKHYQKLLPLMPFAIEQLDVTDYDLVISSESGPAKAIVTRPDALHICYCHSPMRYIWDHYHVYRRELGAVSRFVFSLVAPFLRIWDVTTAARVDAFVSNSVHVSRRIARVYNRMSTVIYPPVAIEDFEPAETVDDYYLCAGQLVTYKRPDLAVQAFTRMNKRLVVIGDGPHLDALKKIAGPTVTFLGRCDFATLRHHLSHCRALVFPGEEDFGILPVEAMASGRPVIAYGAGGAVESIGDEGAGVFFRDQTVDGLIEAVERFEARAGEFDSKAIRARSENFSAARFRREMQTFVETEWARKQSAFERPSWNREPADLKERDLLLPAKTDQA
ncbi:glycosyltransferase [Aureimonas sp. D3]|uniref:glycosyltransferase n=1 Tax=Aureimonas sp. D3 TaxID=1638164 RepID=UPI0009E81CEC|nr:glycosyltransferase [Aureimonas sp. D3]